jgi:hypothetical protein
MMPSSIHAMWGSTELEFDTFLTEALEGISALHIGWITLQLDALRFAARQKLHSVTIDQRYVLQFERDVLTDCFQTRKPLRLCNVLGVDSTTQCKGHSPVRRALNSQDGLLVAPLWGAIDVPFVSY